MKGILWQKQSNTHTSNWQFKSEMQARLGTLGKRVARSSWDIGKRVACSSWGIGKRVTRSSWGFPKQPTARSNDNLPRSWQATFSSCIKHWRPLRQQWFVQPWILQKCPLPPKCMKPTFWQPGLPGTLWPVAWHAPKPYSTQVRWFIV